MTKNYKNSTKFEDVFCELFDNKEKIKDYLNIALASFIEDGNFNAFYKSLEMAIKSQDTVSDFANKINLSKTGLYNIIKGRKEPKVTTLAKILKELACTLRVA